MSPLNPFRAGTGAKEPPLQGGGTWQLQAEECALSLAWAPNGSTLAAGLASGAVLLVNGTSGEIEARVPAHALGLNQVAWSPRGDRFATAGQDGRVGIWASDGTPLATCTPAAEGKRAGWIEHLAWSPDGQVLAAALGREVVLLDAEGALFRRLGPVESTVSDMAWSPPGSRTPWGRSAVLAVSAYGGVTVFRRGADRPLREYRWKGAVVTLAWSPDARFIATGDQDSTVHFWYVESGKDLQMWGYPSKVGALAWDPSSRWLATAGSPAVTIWDCSGPGPAGRRPDVLEEHGGLITALAWQPGGTLLASGAQDGSLRIWAPGRHDRAVYRHDLEGGVVAAVWNHDGGHLAVSGEDGTILGQPAALLLERVLPRRSR